MGFISSTKYATLNVGCKIIYLWVDLFAGRNSFENEGELFPGLSNVTWKHLGNRTENLLLTLKYPILTGRYPPSACHQCVGN